MAKLVSHENDLAVYTTEIAWDTFNKAVNTVYKKNRGRYRVPGFRQGKAPRNIIEMNYGNTVFYEDALNAVLPEVLSEAAKELELEPIGQPDLEIKKIEKNEDLQIEVSQQTMPHPALGEYKGMQVVRTSADVEEAEVDKVIDREREKNAVMNPVDRAAQNGDTVEIDYSGSIDGVKFDGGTAEKQTLELGSGHFIPGFEEQVVGHAPGESFDINVTFPEDYQAKDLAGKEAIFAIVLHEVREKELPALDDDFAQDVSEYDTMDAYRASVREHLKAHAAEDATTKNQNAVIEKLVEVSGITAPKVLVDEQVEVEIRNFANQLGQMGLSLDGYMQYTNATIDLLRQQHEPTARRRVEGDLALASLVREQKIEATAEEIDAEMQELGQTYGAKDPEDFIKRMKEMGQDELVADDVRKKKALDYLMEQVEWVDQPAEEPAVEENEKTDAPSEE